VFSSSFFRNPFLLLSRSFSLLHLKVMTQQPTERNQGPLNEFLHSFYCEDDWTHFSSFRLDATVYIGNLDERVTDSLVWELMLQAGPVGTANPAIKYLSFLFSFSF
jgi:hypothetical protein